jgi:hypothetical protein
MLRVSASQVIIGVPNMPTDHGQGAVAEYPLQGEEIAAGAQAGQGEGPAEGVKRWRRHAGPAGTASDDLAQAAIAEAPAIAGCPERT